MPLLLLLTKTLHTTPPSLADRERERERKRERVTHTQHVQKHCVFVVGGVGKTDGRWRVAVAARMAH